MPASKVKSKQVYQIKITLQGSKPPIWRRVEAPADIRLSALHDVIQIVMDWGGDHLHQFMIGRECYGGAMLVDEGDVEDETKVKLNKLITKEKERFLYEYDFGDSWEHLLEVEKILPAEPDVRYPRCVAGKRAAPPDDCGGVWGYANLLEAIRDPAHPEHENLLEWIDGEFDPEAFDLEAINEKLRGDR